MSEVETTATISERDGLWKIQVRRDRKVAARFETRNVFELVDWLREHYPKAKVPQANYQHLFRTLH